VAALKLAVFGEDTADEVATRILVEAILQEETESVGLFQFRGRGYTNILATLQKVLLHLHYRTDADALAVVIDSDATPLHTSAHDAPNQRDARCRICQMAEQIEEAERILRSRNTEPRLRVALGLAVPAAEAWYLCDSDLGTSEAMWLRTLEGKRQPYTKRHLKELSYGTDRANRTLMESKAEGHAKRLAGDLMRLERCFPNGFGILANTVRRWKTSP
jgi:hypothetical protein